MAPSRPGNRRGPDNVDYANVGKLGRRTGVALEQRPLDVNGMEEISGLFSSPRKPSPLKNMIVMDSPEEQSATFESAKMSGIDSPVITPAQVLSARRSTRGRSLPRSASPRKSGISGAARKSNAFDVFSPSKVAASEDVDEQENAFTTLTPTKLLRIEPQSVVRVNLSTVKSQAPKRWDPSPDKSPLRDVTRKVANTTATPRPSLVDIQQAFSDAPIPEDYEPEPDDYQAAVEEIEAAAEAYDDAASVYSEHYPPVADDGGDQVRESDTPGRSAAEEPPVAPFEAVGDNEVDQTSGSETRSRNKANSHKKRKMEAIGRDEMEDGSPVPAKARKTATNSSRTQRSPKPQPKHMPKKAKGKQPLRPKCTNTQISTTQQAQIDDIVEKVRARPGPPRSLYILRRETPADSEVAHTRSGRVSIKPLAYWRNERCVYGDSPASARLAEGARFPLNSIKEIVRTEEIVDPNGKKSRKKGAGSKQAKRKPGQTPPAEESDLSDSELDDEPLLDPHAEPWETDKGTFYGNVSLWDPDEQGPTEEEEEVELAYAPGAIQTRAVKGVSEQNPATFRYAKLLSTQFFGTGIVDLPVGGVKRPKNSRKMHMGFFVVKGRVTVSVGPAGSEESGMSRFSVGKGGFWQVPRGNQYSIENEMEKPARIFFSQGCEQEPQVGDD